MNYLSPFGNDQFACLVLSLLDQQVELWQVWLIYFFLLVTIFVVRVVPLHLPAAWHFKGVNGRQRVNAMASQLDMIEGQLHLVLHPKTLAPLLDYLHFPPLPQLLYHLCYSQIHLLRPVVNNNHGERTDNQGIFVHSMENILELK